MVTNSKKNKWASEGAYYGLSIILGRLASVVGVFVFTKVLSPSEYGLISIYITIQNLMIIIGGMEVISGVTRYYPAHMKKTSTNILIGSTSIFYIISTISLLLILPLFSDVLHGLVPQVDKRLIYFLCISIFPLEMIQLTLLKFRFERQPLKVFIVSISNDWLKVAAGILLIWSYHYKADGVILGQILVSWLFLFILLPYHLKIKKINFSLKVLKKLLSFGVPIVPARLGGWVLIGSMPLIISNFIGTYGVGIYSVAFQISALFTLAIAAFRMTWLPYSVENYHDGKEFFYVNSLNYYMFSSFMIALCLCTLSGIFVSILADASYYQAKYYIPILIFTNAIDGSINIVSSGNYWGLKTYKNAFGTIIGGGISLIIVLSTISYYGIFSAVIGMALGTIVKALIIYYTSQKTRYIPYSLFNISLFLIVFLLFCAISTYLSIVCLSYISFTLITFIIGLTGQVILFIFLINYNDKINIFKFFLNLFKKN